MAKNCQNCGKNQTITINQKRYCAHCGELLAAVKPIVKAAKPTPKATKLPNVLDLSATTPPKTYHPAQAIHGQRKSQVPPESHPPLHKAAHSSRQASRAKRARTITRHPRIDRFHNPPLENPHLNAAIATQPMAPHHIYQINNLEEEPQSTDMESSKPQKTRYSFKKWMANVKDNFKFVTRRRQLLPTLAILGIVLVLAGYITYLNVPSIAVRIAASRAGLQAQLPNYRPPGYGFKGLVNYSRGQITVRYDAEHSRGYIDLTQRRTQWDPQTLLENYVTPKSRNYLPFNQNGLTIYIYNGNNAAWINNGFFYTLEGKNQLNQDQVLRMAASL